MRIMKTHRASAVFVAATFCTAALAAEPELWSRGAFAAEPAWWTEQKRTCGLDPGLAYNTWQQRGSPCNRGGSSGASSLQQQQLDLAGQFGFMLGQAIRESLERQAQRQAEEAARQAELRRLAREEEERRLQEARSRILAMGKGIAASSEMSLKKESSGGGLTLKTTDSTGALALKVDLDKPVALLRTDPGPDDVRWKPVPLAWREQRDVDFASAAAEGRIRLGSLENIRQLALYDYLLLPGSGSGQEALEYNLWLGNFGPDAGIAAYLNGYTPGPTNPFGQIAAIHDAKGAKWDGDYSRRPGQQAFNDIGGFGEAFFDGVGIYARYAGSLVVYEVEHALLLDGRSR